MGVRVEAWYVLVRDDWRHADVRNPMTKTFWLSFTDQRRPTGDRFLGVCIVEVNETHVALAMIDLPQQAAPGAEWIKAAIQRAWALNCNPGGQVGAIEIQERELRNLKDTPRGVLMSRERLRELGHIDD